MQCPRCSFENESSRLIEIHYAATHEQEMIERIAVEVKAREKEAKKETRARK